MIEHHQDQYSLTKLPHSKLKVMELVLSYYLMSFNPQQYTNEIKSKLSIALAFWHSELKGKINKQFPSKSCKVKFHYHEALVMIEAFMLFQNDTKGIDEHYYNNAIIEVLKTSLHEQVV